MNWGEVRALVRDTNFDLSPGSVDIVLRPKGRPDVITTKGVWLTTDLVSRPSDADYGRAERRFVMALKRSDAPYVPRESKIEAPEVEGGAIKGWIVDGFEGEEVDQRRVLLIPDSGFVP